MKLVPAICPNCGASLQINPGDKAAICEYCKSAFVVEEAVNKYNTFQTTNIQHLHADQVVLNDSGVDKLLNAGHSLILLGKFYDADEKFQQATEEYPGDWRGWWGRVEVLDAAQKAKPGYIGGEHPGEPSRTIAGHILQTCEKNISDLNGGQLPGQTEAVFGRLWAYLEKYDRIRAQRFKEEEQIHAKHEEALKKLDEQEKQETERWQKQREELQQESKALEEQSARAAAKVHSGGSNPDQSGCLFWVVILIAAVCVGVVLSILGLPFQLSLIFLAAAIIAVGVFEHKQVKKVDEPAKRAKDMTQQAYTLYERIEALKKPYQEARGKEEESYRAQCAALEEKYKPLYEAWKNQY